MPLAGPEDAAQSVAALPVALPARPRRRAKVVGLLLAILCFEMGIFLVAFPWSSYWSSNFFSWLMPEWRSVWISPYFRGAISGIGMLNLYMSLLEVFRLQSGSNGTAPRGSGETARMKGLE